MSDLLESRLPDSALCKAACGIRHGTVSDPFLFHHVMRSAA
ncbi:MAG: hypothetical protein R3D52_12095 [Xanthobacteraceae bacterium]